MIEKKKNTRALIILLAELVILLICGIGFRWVFGTVIDAKGYVYMVIGAVSFLVFFTNLRGEPVPYSVGHKHDIRDESEGIKLNITSFVFSMVLFVTSMVLWIVPYNISGPPQDLLASMPPFYHYIVAIDILSLAGTLISMNAWSKYIVKEGCLVLVDGKVLYPGEKYRIWQWENINAQVVKEEFLVKILSLGIRSKNNETLDINIATFAKFDINSAKEMGVRNIDLPIVFRDLETRLSQEIKKQASSNTLGSLFTGKLNPEKFIVAGVPIIWEGRMQTSIGQIKK